MYGVYGLRRISKRYYYQVSITVTILSHAVNGIAEVYYWCYSAIFSL